MSKQNLTMKVIEATKPSNRDVIIWDKAVSGFGLKVTPKGKRSYILYYRTTDHTQRKPTFGTYPAIKPEQAREIAKAMLAEIAKGGDPSADKKRARALRGKGTVAELFDDYRNERLSRLTSGSEVARIFAYDILPALGKIRAEEVGKQDVARLLDKVQRRTLAGARQVKAQLSAFYEWALPRLPDGATNPVKAAGKLPPVPSRDRVLSIVELQRLWEVLEREKETWRIGLRLLILTGQRRSEVFLASWEEFDLENSEWLVPAVRAKNGEAHYVPLSPSAISLISELKSAHSRHGPLFENGRTAASGCSRYAARILSAMGTGEHWRWHDIRRTVATGMQRLGIRREVTEAVLNHRSGSRAGIVGVYQRHDWKDEKRQALDAWASEVTRIISPALHSKNVVEFPDQVAS